MNGFRKPVFYAVLLAVLLRCPCSLADGWNQLSSPGSSTKDDTSSSFESRHDGMSCTKFMAAMVLTPVATILVAGIFTSSIIRALATMRGCFLTNDLHKIIERNGFSKDRTLDDYIDYFGPGFSKALASLPEGSHWIDMGSGNNLAIEEFMQDAHDHGRRVFATGVTYKANRNLSGTIPGLRTLTGRYLENIPNKEIVGPPLGRADMITDVMGVLSYADHVDDTLRTYTRLLKPNGVIYGYASSPNTRIKLRNGSELNLFEWLKTIPGLSVKDDPPSGTFTIRLTKAATKIPELKLQSVVGGCPPSRTYLSEN